MIRSIRVAFTIPGDLIPPTRGEVCVTWQTKDGHRTKTFWIDLPEDTDTLSKLAIDEAMRRLRANGSGAAGP